MQTKKILNLFLIFFLTINFPFFSKNSVFLSKRKPGVVQKAGRTDGVLAVEKQKRNSKNEPRRKRVIKQQVETCHRIDYSLVERGKYCYIVISMPKKQICIWSFLKAKHCSADTFSYIKKKIIVKEATIENLIFEGGHTLYISEDYLLYNGLKYDIGNYINAFVWKDNIELGRFIPFEERPR